MVYAVVTAVWHYRIRIKRCDHYVVGCDGEL